jgi:hypothetical protein
VSLERRLDRLERIFPPRALLPDAQLDAEIERRLDEVAAREGVTWDEVVRWIAAELDAERDGPRS